MRSLFWIGPVSCFVVQAWPKPGVLAQISMSTKLELGFESRDTSISVDSQMHNGNLCVGSVDTVPTHGAAKLLGEQPKGSQPAFKFAEVGEADVAESIRCSYPHCSAAGSAT